MVKKKVKKKRKNRRLEFSQIIQRYKSRDYEGVEKHLPKAYIKAHEKEAARQLKAEMTHRIVMRHIENWEFSKALEQLEKSKQDETPPDMSAINNILEGISHLYLGQWEKAAGALKDTLQNPSTKKLRFYYLLALIYGRKYAQWQDFAREHSTRLKELKSRGEYLRAAFHLTRREWNQAATILCNTKPLSQAHDQQINALCAILRQQPPQSSIDTTLLSPLYKALLLILPPEKEAAYLCSVPPAAPVIQTLLSQNTLSSLHSDISASCEKAQPIDETRFREILQTMPDDHKPYWVYNQAANLLNEDLANNSTHISNLIKEYGKWFFKVPESIFLFFKLFTLDQELFESTDIHSSCLDPYLSDTGTQLGEATQNAIAWHLYEALVDSPIVSKKKTLKYISKWLKLYPNATALYFLLLEFRTRNRTGAKMPPKPIDLFSRPVPKDKAKLIIDTLSLRTGKIPEEAFELFTDDENILHQLRQKSKEKSIGLLSQYMDIISRSAIHYPPTPNDLFVLDIFSFLAKTAGRLSEDYGSVISPDQRNFFSKTWLSLLNSLDQATPKSPYYQAFTDFREEPTVQEINELFFKHGTTITKRKLTTGFSRLMNQGKTRQLAISILRQIDHRHFDQDFEVVLEIFFDQLMKQKPDVAQTISAFFFRSFNQLKAEDPCNCGNEMLLNITNYLVPPMGNSHSSRHIAYQAGLALDNLLLTHSETSSVMAFHLLETCDWLKENSPGFSPAPNLTTQLVKILSKHIPSIKNRKQKKEIRELLRKFEA